MERIGVLSAERIGPRAAHYDELGVFPEDDFDDLHREGLLLATLPKDDGGLGFGFHGDDPLAFYLIIEGLAKVSPSTAHCYQVHCNALQILRAFGRDDQVERFIAPTRERGALLVGAGSEPGGGRNGSEAVRCEGGFALTGVKHYATNATRSEWMTVHVRGREADHLETLVVNTRSPGLTIDASLWNPTGMRSCVSPMLTFKDCFIPDDCILGHPESFFAELWLSKINFGFTANYLGALQGMYEFVVRYFRERGRVQTALYHSYIGELKARIDAARLLFYEAILRTRRDLTQGLLMSNEAKWFAVDCVNRFTALAGQIVGSTAYFREFPLERLTRDMLVHTLHRRHHVGATIVGESEVGLAFNLNNS